MGSGMNTEQAKEYAKTMTYKRAVSNCYHAKGIMFRKATLIKLHELAEIADRLDAEHRGCDNCGTPKDKCVYCIEEDRMWTPQTEREGE